MPVALTEGLWSDPDRLIDDGELLKDGDRTTVVCVKPARGEGTFVLKRYNLCDPLHTAIHGIIRSRARWCWANGEYLRATGIRTPRPLVCLELRVGPLRGRSFLLTEYVDARDLLAVVDDDACPRERVERLAHEFGRIWHALGRQRVGFGDTKATNFLVDAHDRIWVVDLDGMRVYGSSSRLRRKRERDYDRFMRNWQGREEVAALFRAQLDGAPAPAAR